MTRRHDRTSIKPFLRWAGGKQWLAQRLAGVMPKDNRTYYEPFLGGGSLFFAARPKRAVLGDTNERLINTFRVLRDQPRDLIRILSQWSNDRDTYYAVRSTNGHDEVWNAAQFIYLNKTCWNGLHRVNKQGQFNVPFGNHDRNVFDEAHLLTVSQALQAAELRCCDFQDMLQSAEQNAFVYMDPPYTVLHSQNGFRQYNEKIFSWHDQIRLARVAHDLADRGCIVVISNADNAEVLDLYPEFHYQRVSRHSILAANPKYRRKTQEALLVSSACLLLSSLDSAERSSCSEFR